MPKRSQLLALIDDDAVYNRILPLCDRSSLHATRASDAAGARLLLQNMRYDLIVARHPMAGVEVEQFLEALRRPHMPSADSPVLLLAPESDIERLMHRVDQRQVQVLSLGVSTRQLQKAISEILGVAARTETRMLIQFEVVVGEGRVARVCQAKNISETGALLHTSRTLPVGTILPVSFTLADDPRPILGTARVVRHAELTREDLPGMGISFERMDGEARERMREFITACREVTATGHSGAVAVN